MAGESLIIVRDQSGDNARILQCLPPSRDAVCARTKSGQFRAIQCPYHAWTYGLDGRLIGAPHMDDVPGFDKAEHSFHAVNLALWEGFIFVNLADSDASTQRGGYIAGGMVRAVGRKIHPLESAETALGANGSSMTSAQIGS